MSKKIVHYDADRGVMEGPSNGMILYPVDHPDSDHVSNRTAVLTSPVVSFDEESGVIETTNTIYHPNRA